MGAHRGFEQFLSETCPRCRLPGGRGFAAMDARSQQGIDLTGRTICMRIITILSLSLCLSFGCTYSDHVSPADESEVEEELGEVEQGLSSHCACPVGQYWSSGGYCTSFVVGPAPSPSYGACGADCNCPSGTRCTNTSTAPGSYGFCVVPACSAEMWPSYIPVWGTGTFRISATNMPSGSYALVSGTRNGYPDASNVRFPGPGDYSIGNYPGMAGYYMRYADLYM